VEIAATCPPPINRRLIAGATVAITVLVLITVVSEYVEGQIGWVRLIIDVLVGVTAPG
jgi:hypothetical protein